MHVYFNMRLIILFAHTSCYLFIVQKVMVPSNSDIDMAPASPVMEPTTGSATIKDKDTTMRSEDERQQQQQQQKPQEEEEKGDNSAAKDSLQPEEDVLLSTSEDRKESLKSEGESHDVLKMDTDDGTDADTTIHATSLSNGTSATGQHPADKTTEKKPRKYAERESKRGHKSSKANGHTVEEEDQEMEHQARHPSDDKYRRLKRKLKEVLEVWNISFLIMINSGHNLLCQRLASLTFLFSCHCP